MEPRTTVFETSLLATALICLKPVAFKLFVSIYNSMEDYEEQGNLFQQCKEEDLTERLGLCRDELVDAFINLRQFEYLDAFVVFYTTSENVQTFIYRWYMGRTRKLGEKISNHYIETDNPFDDHRKYEHYVIIGTEQVAPFKMQRKQRRKRKITAHWKTIRKQALRRDGNKCTKCEGTNNLHIHHLTYENEGKEKLEDVITLCRSCHAKEPKWKSGVGSG